MNAILLESRPSRLDMVTSSYVPKWGPSIPTQCRKNLIVSSASCKANRRKHCQGVYLKEIVNVLTVTFTLTLSMTNFNFKIEHANISKSNVSNFLVLLSFR